MHEGFEDLKIRRFADLKIGGAYTPPIFQTVTNLKD